MTDNTDEEHLDNPITNQSENPPAEITPTGETKAITQNHETENMEVHHHSHTGHGKKTWKEYFWEFLMLFLAVFCGFLAEYQLEHKIEKDRLKKFMYDMTKNLEYDRTRIAINLPANYSERSSLDSFRNEIQHTVLGKANIKKLYYYAFSVGGVGKVVFNKSTITQLRNSGQLRLVENDSLTNDIIDYYDRKVYASEYFGQYLDDSQNELLTEIRNIFSTIGFESMLKITDSAYNNNLDDNLENEFKNEIEKNNLKLLTTDKITLEKLHSLTVTNQLALFRYIQFLNYTNQSAEKLIAKIKLTYHFD
jgi:hypothetical protein